MSSEVDNVVISGLQNSNNTFSSSPPGSLSIADNVIIAQANIAQPRRGQERFGGLIDSDPTNIPQAITEFEGFILANYTTSRVSPVDYGLGYYSNPTTFNPYTGEFPPVDCSNSDPNYYRMKFGFLGDFMQFCRGQHSSSNAGSQVLERSDLQPRRAGLPPMPDIALINMVSNSDVPSTDALLPYGFSVAYRSELAYTAVNGVIIESPPSARAVISNRILAPTGGMVRAASTVTVTLPDGFPSFLQPGDTFKLTPGELNFAAATYTVASTIDALNFTYTSSGSATTNTAPQDFDTGPRAVQITPALPSEATTTIEVRLYRSLNFPLPVEPDDELFQVKAAFPTPTDITNKSMNFIDQTPEGVLNDPLYTNPATGEGSLQTNFRPPLYRDITSWNQRTWFSNTTQIQSIELQMLGIGTPGGIQDGDTLIIGTDTYTFTTGDSIDFDVHIYTDVNNTPTTNIRLTTAALIQRINAVSASFYAYSNSDQLQGPGKILITAQTMDGTSFEVLASRPTSWTPALNTDPTGPNSTDNRQVNSLFYSKLDEPEAVPIVNELEIGSKNWPIRRIIPLRNALLVFKEGDGVFAVTGSGDQFTVTSVATPNIIAPDAAALFADKAWVYTDQGFLSMNEQGNYVVQSRPIEVQLEMLRAISPQDTKIYSHCVAYESERQIVLWVPTAVTGSVTHRPMLGFSYNLATNTWTNYNKTITSGVISKTENLLYLANPETFQENSQLQGAVTRERKDYEFTDYSDESITDTIIAADPDGFSFEIANQSILLSLEVGDGIYQLQTNAYSTDFPVSTLITKIDVSNNLIYAQEPWPWNLSEVQFFKAYSVEIQFNPVSTQSPTSNKTMSRMTWVFKPEEFNVWHFYTTFLTEQSQAQEAILGQSLAFGWGPFGSTPFGDPSVQVLDYNPVPINTTKAAQFFLGCRTHEAWLRLKIQGLTLETTTNSAPVSRSPKVL